MRFGSRYGFDRLMLLAPRSSSHAEKVGSLLRIDSSRHNFYLREAQRLRGFVYLQDGAVDLQRLTRDGRLVHERDEYSWQLLVMSRAGRVSGCARYVPHDDHVSFSDLGVAKSALAYSPTWGARLRDTVEAERLNARNRGMIYGELGGWALAEDLRYSSAALQICLNMVGLMKLLGGALAITTATFRHQSSAILRKMGCRQLVSDGGEFPSYYDQQYECEMEILRFDSDHPTPKYIERIHECEHNLENGPVIGAPALAPDCLMSL